MSPRSQVLYQDYVMFSVIMHKIRFLCMISSLVLTLTAIKPIMGSEVAKEEYEAKFSKEELQERLTPEQYHVTQERGTERAFTGAYNDKKDPGIYRCVVCHKELFNYSTKYNSRSGWPSFYDVIDEANVKKTVDASHGMHRVEVVCAHCGAHLGHVFDDGPKPTGLRYCINSASLDFKPQAELACCHAESLMFQGDKEEICPRKTFYCWEELLAAKSEDRNAIIDKNDKKSEL